MPNTNQPLPIQCPKCEHVGSTLVIKSHSVMTLTCAGCGHFWATAFEWLSSDIQKKVTDSLGDTYPVTKST